MSNVSELIGSVDRKRALAAVALHEAKRRGATFADVRIVRHRIQTIVAKDQEIVGVRGEWHYGPRPDRVWGKEDVGFNVRALKNGAWGFVASPLDTDDESRAIALPPACICTEAAAKTKVRDIVLYRNLLTPTRTKRRTRRSRFRYRSMKRSRSCSR